MQRYCTELTERLLKSLDKEYNVVDTGTVVDVITALEKTTITKEALEVTRLGRHINELRRKTNNDALAKRAKDLVRRWREMLLPSSHPTPQPTPADTAPQALNGTKPQSPALRGLKPHSPAAIRALKPHSPALKASLKPHSPLLRASTPLKVLSPALSLHSDRSRSPNQQQHVSSSQISSTTNTTNNRLSSDVTSKLALISTHNHTFDAVPRTHSSNKRLRKDDSSATNSPIISPLLTVIGTSLSGTNRSNQALSINDANLTRGSIEPMAKRPRLNGETSNYQNFSQTTTTTTTTTTTETETETCSDNFAQLSRAATRESVGANVASSQNQKVPSPRDMEKTNDRLSEIIACNAAEKIDKIAAPTVEQAPSGPKKRGRKKGSKSVKNQALPEDRVKEKLASISRNPKLKTTQELLADLQARGSSTGANFSTGTTTAATTISTISTISTNPGSATTATSITSRNTVGASNEEKNLRGSAVSDDRSLSSRFSRAKRLGANLIGGKKRKNHHNRSVIGTNSWENSRKTNDDFDKEERYDDEDEDDDDEDDDDSVNEITSVDNVGTRELTVEEILAKLPPIDLDAISWSDCDDDKNKNDDDDNDDDNGGADGNDDGTKKNRKILDIDVDRLHGECVEGLNGNFQTKIYDETIKPEIVPAVRNEGEIIDEIKGKCVYRRFGESENNEREFREWHEMLARPSYEGQTLHILPYVIID